VDGKVHRAMDEMFEMEVTYVEGEASFVQTFTITEAAYEVSGYLTYGACSDQNCMPPTDVEFSFKGQSDAVADPAAKTTENEMRPEENKIPSGGKISEGHENWWKPVVEELQSFGQDEQAADNTLWGIFLLGFLGGFVALFTPCVWPIIPMTVSFFLKRSQDKRKGVRDAVLYGVSIVVIYVLLGLLVTMIFGASALNALSTNAVFNIFFFLMLLFFAASFLGGFEITLPSKWTNAVDKKSESTTGLLSIFLMAFTLSLVSFSCTGPIIGFLLVEVSTTGSVVAPTIGMLGFAVALALPFTLFALFPAWLKSAPKSGNWMNCIKVCLGFLELAFALKFLSVADLAYGWRILDREVFLSIWIVLFALLGAYLIGWIRFPHDEDEYDDMGEVVVNHRTSVPRFFMGLASLAFALYMVPGLWGAPCKAVSAFAPPMSTQDFNLYQSEVKARFHDYEEGMAYAQANGLPVMLDFTGYGCVNCRKMEAAVWTDIKVADLLNEKYVLITLFVDDKTPLAEPIVVTENGAERKLRTIGDKWSYLQRSKFGANAQPFYVLLDNEGMPLNKSYSFNENVADYVTFLQQGLKAYHK
ncbi:MAG: cytochrome c biogenesis protein CcdA, partial [Bacteroidaceae bacterium]|nr:cytochrome c biogenesis protein CcdA [Bacteroidaceae bacterium]